ncbi:hypothetical protein P3T73_00225 [Kiritimatiellota bacterium B12222]|nr:hypothetical protein P3T73_00225 [Kiritimatiellota bacterium B12222]
MIFHETIHLGPRPQTWTSDWSRIMTHTHHMRGEGFSLEETNQKLIEWCSKFDIQAVGVGSPWEPVSSEAYGRYEGAERDAYYAGRIAMDDVKGEKEVRHLLSDLNQQAQGKTTFYLDNETPKCRYGHIWWFGWNFDVPAWHDYSQDRPIQYFRADQEIEINPLTGMPHRRRPYLEIFREQRLCGARGIWAHPTSWWWEGDKFITNIASDAGVHLLTQGRLDGMVVMGYHPYRTDYLNLWYDWLDLGAVIPAFAEMDAVHNRPTMYSNSEQPTICAMRTASTDPKDLTACAARGECVSTTGASLWLESDQVGMGGIHRLQSGDQVSLTLSAWPAQGESHFSRLQLIGKNGRIIQEWENFPGGQIQLQFEVQETPGYLLLLGFGPLDDPHIRPEKEIESLAISNPIYFQAPDWSYSPTRTQLRLSAGENSIYQGQQVQAIDHQSKIIWEGCLDQTHELDLPGDASLRFPERRGDPDLFLCMENAAVQEIIAYLWQGLFLDDYPDLQPGQVPPQAWKLDKLSRALQEQELIL